MGVQLPSEPINRHEQYLAKIAGQAVEIPAEPLTREEAYLDYIAKHGGGGGGTGDYDELLNQPKINDVTLKGNKSASDLGLASASALANKVDKVAGKDLSSNDYSDSEKQKNADNATAISAIKDGATIDSFADVESALSNKQDTLTAGDYISLNNGNIAVNRNIVRDNYAYNIKFSGDNDLTVTKSQGGTVISTTQYTYEYGSGGGVTYTIDDAFTLETIYYGGQYFKYTALRDSTTHSAGYTWQVEAHDTSTDVTEYFPTEDLSGYKLVIKSELDAAISSAYHHAGTKTCAELVVGLLVAANEGNVYNMTDSGTTTSDFIEGAGQPIKAGDNVGVAKISDGVYKFDLLSGFVDTTNFVQKSQTAGLLKNDGTVNDEIEGDVSTLKSGFTALDNEVNGDAVTYPYADVITIEDAVPSNLADCSVKVEPVQDLHGYDKPWVGGAGKNKLPLVLADLKTANATGTWADNVYTINGGTITVNTDDGGNVLSIVANGTFSPSIRFNLSYPLIGGFLNGCHTGGGWSKYVILQDGIGGDEGNGFSGAVNNVIVQIYINSGIQCDNLTFRPMVVDIAETDKSFAPYTNICPISGHTEVSVHRDGVNIFNPNTLETFDANGEGVIRTGHIFKELGKYTVNNKNSNNIFGRLVKTDLSEYGQYVTILNNTHASFTVSEGYMLYVYYEAVSGMSAENICVKYGDDTTFIAYAGQQYTLALGDTIYGGTVDFDSGVMTVDRAYSKGFTRGSVDSTGKLYSLVSTTISNLKNVASITDVTTIKSNMFTADSVNNARANLNKVLCQYAATIFVGGYIDDETALDALLPDLEICYELATPTTIQLTPQQIQLLQGTNTLYASTGDISVSVNGVSGAIGAVQEQANATDNALAQLAADIAEQLPDAPTTDGAYVLTVTVADGEATYSWESAE